MAPSQHEASACFHCDRRYPAPCTSVLPRTQVVHAGSVGIEIFPCLYAFVLEQRSLS